MRRAILVLPDLLAETPEDSSLIPAPPTLERLSSRGRVLRLAAPRESTVPEAAWIGLDPSSISAGQGALTVAALGFEPPVNSVRFHLSLMSLSDGQADWPQERPNRTEERLIMEAAQRLTTKRLTVIEGRRLDHGLVWEAGSLDVRTVPASEVLGRPIRPNLPEGDGEALLRRLIDDSVNLLTDLEVNRVRLDEGRPAWNLLWPWGQSRGVSLPNLWLQRGERAFVTSGSLRLAGICSLAKWEHSDWCRLGSGTAVQLTEVAKSALGHPVTVSVIESFSRFRNLNQREEARWLIRELDERLLAPLYEASMKEPVRIVLAAPGSQGGLALVVEPGDEEGKLPFDERALDARDLRTVELWKLMEESTQWQESPAALG
jgi:2,3-bisphosphoglycerate-independent phosphoglycerate mutase